MLDGQQRITSIGRFVTDKFAIHDGGNPKNFTSVPKDQQQKINESKLLIYEYEGTETEIKEWFQTINIAGVSLNEQELLNAIYSRLFVTKAKEQFSNSQNANIQVWSAYIKGSANRQDFLERAMDWVSKGDIGGKPMSQSDKNHTGTALPSFRQRCVSPVEPYGLTQTLARQPRQFVPQVVDHLLSLSFVLLRPFDAICARDRKGSLTIRAEQPIGIWQNFLRVGMLLLDSRCCWLALSACLAAVAQHPEISPNRSDRNGPRKFDHDDFA